MGLVRSYSQERLIDYVQPFVGTTNYGTTNPGALVPRGMSVVPFNVVGSDLNRFDKDRQWWEYTYEHTNGKCFTGFSHVNLSGVSLSRSWFSSLNAYYRGLRC